MTLAVSLRVPDGLVIAADSLATTLGHIGISADLNTKCPECKKDIKLERVPSPPIPIPASVSSFAQKVFPFQDKFGIATYGMAILNEKTIYYHVKMLEKGKNKKLITATEVADIILKYFDKEIRKQVKDLNQAPENFSPLGFLIAGYDEDIGKTIIINIGRKSRKKEQVGSGCTWGGDGQVVNQLWELGKKDPRRSTQYGGFSLQDAVDYAEYLINATANYQRFANMIPSVGGEVDIGLITPFRPFTWIKCKALTEQIEKQVKEVDSNGR